MLGAQQRHFDCPHPVELPLLVKNVVSSAMSRHRLLRPRCCAPPAARAARGCVLPAVTRSGSAGFSPFRSASISFISSGSTWRGGHSVFRFFLLADTALVPQKHSVACKALERMCLADWHVRQGGIRSNCLTGSPRKLPECHADLEVGHDDDGEQHECAHHAHRALQKGDDVEGQHFLQDRTGSLPSAGSCDARAAAHLTTKTQVRDSMHYLSGKRHI